MGSMTCESNPWGETPKAGACTVQQANPELPILPEGQREIMEIVWDQGEVSVFEVREILGQSKEISRTAVRTTMERLEEKGMARPPRHRPDPFLPSARLPRRELGAADR